jgi:hypothetical protein
VAEIPRTLSGGGGFYLHPYDSGAEVEGHVEGGGFSPGLEDDVTVAKGLGDELGFHPFAAFFVVPELGHAAPGAIAESRFELQMKRRDPMGRAWF